MTRRVQVGHQLRVVGETHEGVQLEGAARLHPGQLVDLVLDSTPGALGPTRRVVVVSWSVARLGKDGPTYAGMCRWQ